MVRWSSPQSRSCHRFGSRAWLRVVAPVATMLWAITAVVPAGAVPVRAGSGAASAATTCGGGGSSSRMGCVWFYTEDADAEGRIDDLVTVGTVRYDDDEGRWAAEIDWERLVHVSELPSDEAQRYRDGRPGPGR